MPVELFHPQILELFSSAFFGFCIGFERTWKNKVAGIRTFSMIALGACLFTIVSKNTYLIDPESHDLARIAAQVVSGVGFLGAGVVFKTANRVEGITTAGMIWLTAAIGMACGFGDILLASQAFLLWAFINVISMYVHKIVSRVQKRQMT